MVTQTINYSLRYHHRVVALGSSRLVKLGMVDGGTLCASQSVTAAAAEKDWQNYRTGTVRALLLVVLTFRPTLNKPHHKNQRKFSPAATIDRIGK